MKLDSPKIKITTSAGGAFSQTVKLTKGLLYKIVWTQGGLAATTDLTITSQNGTTVFSQSNITANFEKYPRTLQHLNTDGTALTTHDYYLVDGPLTLTIAQGGATATGYIELFVTR